jgi:hypothetical protein
VHSIPDLSRILHFGHIRSFSVSIPNIDFHFLTINDLNVLKTNKYLVELFLHIMILRHPNDSQQVFNFICDNFTQLKSFYFRANELISMSKSKLINLENFILSVPKIDSFLMDKNDCFNKTLKPLRSSASMTPTLFKGLVQMFANVENIYYNSHNLKCEHSNHFQHNYFKCKQEVINYLSKLNRLKVLEINGFSCATIKAIEMNINEHTFKQLEELTLWDREVFHSKLLFIHLIQSLTQLCDRNTKQLFTLRINRNYIDLITEKKTINGIEYNVFFDCEKFEKNYGNNVIGRFRRG